MIRGQRFATLTFSEAATHQTLRIPTVLEDLLGFHSGTFGFVAPLPNGR
jgi:hypothetical protein